MNMKTIRLLATCLTLLVLASCGQNSSSYKKLQKQYDSLQVVTRQSDQNLEEMLAIINDIEQNFADIREAEDYVTVKRTGNDLNATTREEIRSNMQLISETLKKNREQLAKLNEQVKNNAVKSKSLTNKIARMTKELQARESELVALRDELAQKNIRISELDSLNSDLYQNVRDLSTTTQQQEQKIKEQEAGLYTGYYCFGSVSELKDQKILAGGGLFSSLKVLPEGFNKDYFLSVDTREVSTISLFAKKARVRTQHPSSSYEFVPDADGNQVLHITDKEAFWSLSKYLVIEVML